MQIDPRKAGIVIGAVAVVVGAWLGIDELIVTEEERLEEFANAVTGPVDAQRIDAAVANWTDPSVQPVEVTAFGRSEVYDGSNAAELGPRARGALVSYGGERLRKLQQGIELVGEDRARVALRIVSGRGMVNAEFELRKHGDRWLVSEARIHR